MKPLTANISSSRIGKLLWRPRVSANFKVAQKQPQFSKLMCFGYQYVHPTARDVRFFANSMCVRLQISDMLILRTRGFIEMDDLEEGYPFPGNKEHWPY